MKNTPWIILASLFLVISCASLKDNTPKKVLVPLAKGELKEKHEAFGNKYMIASQGTHTTQAAAKMFEQGGNIMDAAVAASFAISVERPHSTGIGGGGFMLYSTPKMERPVTMDFREKAPLAGHETMFLDDEGKEVPRMSLDGIFAAGVPGLVAGVLEAHKKYGSLPLRKVMAPAIEMADKGIKVYPELAKALQIKKEVLARFEASKKIFFKDGKPLKLGDTLVQKDLAKTLRTISKKGRDGFYKGWVAKALVKENQRLKGLMTQEDLDKYNVKYRTPVEGTFKGYKIFSMSPPSSGGTHVVQILNILEQDDLKKRGILDPKTIHLTASAMQRAFRDRAEFMGDSDFVDVPIDILVSKRYAKDSRQKIPEHQALTKSWVSPARVKRYIQGPDQEKSSIYFYDTGTKRNKHGDNLKEEEERKEKEKERILSKFEKKKKEKSCSDINFYDRTKCKKEEAEIKAGKKKEKGGFFSNMFKNDNPGSDINFYDRKKKKVKKESPETTHFTIMDGEGNSIVSTQTINGYFGSAVVVPGTGIVLNNEMDDFSTKPGAKNLFGAVGSIQNLVQPEKRPLSSMSPTLVYKDNKPVLALGTPSGTRILTCVAQTILNYIEHDLPLYDAVAALRYHHQWSPDELRVEEPGFPRKIYERLKIMNHKISKKNLGCRIQAVAMEDGLLHGVSDPRGQGEAFGK